MFLRETSIGKLGTSGSEVIGSIQAGLRRLRFSFFPDEP
jgi:hypothetical protein